MSGIIGQRCQSPLGGISEIVGQRCQSPLVGEAGSSGSVASPR